MGDAREADSASRRIKRACLDDGEREKVDAARAFGRKRCLLLIVLPVDPLAGQEAMRWWSAHPSLDSTRSIRLLWNRQCAWHRIKVSVNLS
jgi:hypothetical protein